MLLGVDGVLDGERRRARFVASNRGVPAMTVAVGERATIEAALAGASTRVTVDLDLVASDGRRRRAAWSTNLLA